jgi:monofunctional biosynthetic peptidoglycan transglycosylase
MKRLIVLLSLLAAAAGGEIVNEPRTILEFDAGDGVRWSVVNDGVMGGISRSAILGTDDGTAIFSGTLSLENNGGFASVRRSTGGMDLTGRHGFLLRVRGDGRTYQLRLRNEDGWDGPAYRASFATADGEWTEVRLPFADFEPTWRGRVLADAPPLDPARIRQIGFLLADKRPGPFSLEIDRLLAE